MLFQNQCHCSPNHTALLWLYPAALPNGSYNDISKPYTLAQHIAAANFGGNWGVHLLEWKALRMPRQKGIAQRPFLYGAVQYHLVAKHHYLEFTEGLTGV